MAQELHVPRWKDGFLWEINESRGKTVCLRRRKLCFKYFLDQGTATKNFIEKMGAVKVCARKVVVEYWRSNKRRTATEEKNGTKALPWFFGAATV